MKAKAYAYNALNYTSENRDEVAAIVLRANLRELLEALESNDEAPTSFELLRASDLLDAAPIAFDESENSIRFAAEARTLATRYEITDLSYVVRVVRDLASEIEAREDEDEASDYLASWNLSLRYER